MPDHPEGKQHEGEHFEGGQPGTKSVPQLILLTKKPCNPGQNEDPAPPLLLPCFRTGIHGQTNRSHRRIRRLSILPKPPSSHPPQLPPAPGTLNPVTSPIATAQALRSLPNREALLAWLAQTLPATPITSAPAPPAPTRTLEQQPSSQQQPGGRPAALAQLHAMQPLRYAGTRNFLDGAVTRLSPYLRHGVLTLAEVRDYVLSAVPDTSQAHKQPEKLTEKLIQELAWRDYWQRLYAQLGNDIWHNREPHKTGWPADTYQPELPPELTTSPPSTTLACIDEFAHQLIQTGYLHNHARMWFAAWLVHWRRVRWQTGARWFLQHLLDGDPASNNLSWQWVASTFAAKPYFFNRENLERYTHGTLCRTCSHATSGTCPFEATYDDLSAQLFPRLGSHSQEIPAPPPAFNRPGSRHREQADQKPDPPASSAILARPLLWIHTDSLNPELAAFAAHPSAPAVFLWDTDWITEDHIDPKRLLFLAECLQAMPPHLAIQVTTPATAIPNAPATIPALTEALLAEAARTDATCILAQRTPDPRLLQAASAFTRQRPGIPILWSDPPPFINPKIDPDLRRFSRYWQRAQASAQRPTATQS
jgi:deoxyribodipyrimidine photo-lyase